MFYVYIIRSERDSSFYIGYSSNLTNRLKDHNFGSTRYTKLKRPWSLVYFEEYNDKNGVIKREKYLKRLKSKKCLEKIIETRARSSTGRATAF